MSANGAARREATRIAGPGDGHSHVASVSTNSHGRTWRRTARGVTPMTSRMCLAIMRGALYPTLAAIASSDCLGSRAYAYARSNRAPTSSARGDVKPGDREMPVRGPNRDARRSRQIGDVMEVGGLAHQALDGAGQGWREVGERGREPVEQCNAQRVAGLALEHFEKTTRLIIVAMQHDLMKGLMRAVPAELSDRAKRQW